MDLISSLLFATIIMPYLRKGTEDMDPDAVKAQVRKTMLGASAIAALLLMASYIGLTFLAAHHASNLPPLPPEEVLQAIAIRVLGPVGSLIAVSIVFLACLTTAMSLVAVCSEYVRSTFFLKKKESILPLVITLACAGLMSNLGFSGLMKIVGPAMQILYPALIALCVTNIAYNLYRVRSVKVPVYAALGLGFMGFILAY
jgi:LIVCS family branched-chain amino acid:cation transporter